MILDACNESININGSDCDYIRFGKIVNLILDIPGTSGYNTKQIWNFGNERENSEHRREREGPPPAESALRDRFAWFARELRPNRRREACVCARYSAKSVPGFAGKCGWYRGRCDAFVPDRTGAFFVM